jgi:3,4-dihydroxy 2-butanone 4-phosphate synthase/GTP cyclohydrolase II
MTHDVANRLELPAMVADNRDPKGTAYTVTVDARDGIGTGIGAADRTHTLNLLASPHAGAAEFVRPGHVLPLRAHPDGLLRRRGHTEAAIALCDMAGLAPVGAIAELVGADGEAASRAEAHQLGVDSALPMIDVAELADAFSGWSTFRGQRSPAGGDLGRVHRRGRATLPTRHGTVDAVGYFDCATGDEHVALVSGSLTDDPICVRIHSQCMTSEVLGSRRCDCAEQLDAAIATIAARGGVVIYLSGQEGRGIGLAAKLAAYQLQDHDGLDTVDANLALNVPVDSREYGAALAILADMNITEVRLLTGNPAKVSAVRGGGIIVTGVEPLTVSPTVDNWRYLHAKKARLGHVC